jgi:hypothetical protein
VAQSETFQAVLNGGYDRALARTFIRFTHETSNPIAVVDVASSDDEQVAGGEQSHTRPQVRLWLELVIAADPNIADTEERKLRAIDTLAKIKKEVRIKAAEDDSTNLESNLNLKQGPTEFLPETATEDVANLGELWRMVAEFQVED